MAKKPYMPLMMGDWIRGTRGMKAGVKGVYIGLLIHQYDEGFIPSDLETLALIEPEVGSVWVSLVSKFPEFEPGKRRNPKLEEVRAFWSKQAENGSKGGRPKIETQTEPKHEPKFNPNTNPKPNHHIDLDIDLDSISRNKESFEKRFKSIFDERAVENYKMNFREANIEDQLKLFMLKCNNANDEYWKRDKKGLMNAFQAQLVNVKSKPSARGNNPYGIQ